MSRTSSSGSGLAAVWTGVQTGFAVQSQPLPVLRPGEVLVAVELATICGSDLHTVAGDRTTPLPTVLGHEAIGEIVATGGPVTGATGQPLTPGDRITWTVGTSCGSCRRCRRGMPQKCDTMRKYGHEAMDEHWRLNGGLATHCHLLAGTGLIPAPAELPAPVAEPANCATATVTCAARRVDLAADDAVVVLGCGMLGLTAVAYARDRGVERLVACDVDPVRRELATRFGATEVCTPHELVGRHDADVVFELSGSSRAVQSAFRLLDVGGRIALVGSVSPACAVSFEPSDYVKNLSTVVGVHNYRVDDLVEAVDFLRRSSARRHFAALVPSTFPLAEIDDAMAAARTGAAARVGVRMS